MLSPISGAMRLEFTGKPLTQKIPYRRAYRVSASIQRPKAYWIPPAWSDVVQRLELHGIQFERIAEARDLEVTVYRLEEARLLGTKPGEEAQPFEGHVQMTAKPVALKRTEHFPAGSVRVPANQPLGNLAAVLLEPASPDSFFQWGFFGGVLQATEYIEEYIMEPMAEKMLAADPKLAAEFREKLETRRSLPRLAERSPALVLHPHALHRRTLENLSRGAGRMNVLRERARVRKTPRGERTRLACWPRRPAVTNFSAASAGPKVRYGGAPKPAREGACVPRGDAERGIFPRARPFAWIEKSDEDHAFSQRRPSLRDHCHECRHGKQTARPGKTRGHGRPLRPDRDQGRPLETFA